MTKYDPNHGGASFSIAGIGVKNTSTYIELSIRVIDATTGEVVSVVKADGTASAHSLDVSVATKSGAPVSSDAFKNTPLAQAAESAIHKAVGQMDIGLEHAPWSAMVVDAEDNHIVINAGANQNIQVGMKLQAYHKGKVLTDPGTGEVLETNFEPLGTVMVQDVHEKVSTGILVDGAARPAATSCAIEEMTMNRSILVAALVCGAGLVSALARGRADQALRGNAQTATSPT